MDCERNVEFCNIQVRKEIRDELKKISTATRVPMAYLIEFALPLLRKKYKIEEK